MGSLLKVHLLQVLTMGLTVQLSTFTTQKLQGIVNECRPSHMSLLVFNYFNAIISGDQLRAAGYSFDAELDHWTSSNESIAPQDKVNFIVEKIHELGGTVSLEGKYPSLSLLVEA